MCDLGITFLAISRCLSAFWALHQHNHLSWLVVLLGANGQKPPLVPDRCPLPAPTAHGPQPTVLEARNHAANQQFSIAMKRTFWLCAGD